MPVFRNIFFSLLVLFIFTVTVKAQNPSPKNGIVAIVQEISLKGLPANERYFSMDGKFIVSLPHNVTSFLPITPQNSDGKRTGSLYRWRVHEGIIAISYTDSIADLAIKTDEDYKTLFAGVKYGILKGLNAKVTAEETTTLGNYQGVKIGLQLPDGSFGESRMYASGNRQYAILALYSKDVPDADKTITQTLTTFRLLGQEEIKAELNRQVAEVTPAPLPQLPITKKEKSDAQDDRLKGRVKSVSEEREEVSASGKSSGKQLSSIEEYDEKGSKLKQIFYDYRGNPYDITVFGFIDGARVSNSKSIRYEYDPPPPLAVKTPNPEIKRDSRYRFRIEYQYLNGKLAERRLLGNDDSGNVIMRYVYNYQGNQMEELVYDDKNKLNQKFLTIFDAKGNEIEQTYYDLLQPQIYGDKKYRTVYNSFDEKGNWIKETVSMIENKDGKEVSTTSYIKYRTITYYP